MPKILDDYVAALRRQGKTKDQAYAIATSQLQRQGVLRTGTRELTDMGKSAVKKARKKFQPRRK
jgi:hypothetical protein